jgi:hypothetical protein
MFHNNKNNIIDFCYTIIISSTQDKGFMEKRGRFIEKRLYGPGKERRRKEGRNTMTNKETANQLTFDWMENRLEKSFPSHRVKHTFA